MMMMRTIAPPIYFGNDPSTNTTITDETDAHVMTIAPTGAGKGRTSIIPNLLEWPGSVFVIDPKGENAACTFNRRCKGLGQNVHILDPFNIAKIDKKSVTSSRFNPLNYVDLGPAGITQADHIADTLIVKGNEKDSFFTDEARILLKTLLLHVRTHPNHEGSRNLGTVNRIASDPRLLLFGDAPEMLYNPSYDGLIARLSWRMRAKPDREAGGVWSTVQSNLGQFLDDPRVANNLSQSDFDFADLLKGNTSIYVVLPAPYLGTFSRWLRLLVGTALDRLLIEGMGEQTRPKIPVLFVLDEFAHLGELEVVKTAYGLARGAGVKIWAILQSLSQLDDIYGEHGRENLVANSGAIEIFNMNDNHGCKYFSERIGDAYMKVKSSSISTTSDANDKNGHGRGGAVNEITQSDNLQDEKRERMLPGQIARLGRDKKLIFRRDRDFVAVDKVCWDKHPGLRKLAGI